MRRAEYERESSRYVVEYRPTAAFGRTVRVVEPARAAGQLVARAAAWYVLAVSCAAAGAALLLASPLVLGHVFDHVLPHEDSTELSVLALVLIGLGAVQAIILLARVVGEGRDQRRISRARRRELLRHFAALPQSATTPGTAGFVLRTMTATHVVKVWSRPRALCVDSGDGIVRVVLILPIR